ncbi:MmgE/PrpD family protein [Salmonella enterica subsp. enterica serovar Infantis]
MSTQELNIRPDFDREIVDIVDYVMNYDITSKVAYDTAHYCLLDTLGCGLEALEYPACKKLLGPIVPGTVVPNGARVPGTQFQLDPVQAAFNIGAMIRWLDFNDTWLAAEWGHPSDNLGGILAIADWLSRNAVAAVEAAMTLYEQMQAAGKTAADIEKVTIRTHEACLRIIDKKGPLNNPADRDHCIQYMVAVPLLFGRLTAADYEDEVAQDKRIDALREKIVCYEDPAFTADYHDPEKRAIGNAITVEFTDGSRFGEVVVEYPIGHARRRADGIPKLIEKFKINLARQFPTRQQQRILDVSLDRARLEQMPVNEYLDLYVI